MRAHGDQRQKLITSIIASSHRSVCTRVSTDMYLHMGLAGETFTNMRHLLSPPRQGCTTWVSVHSR